MNIKQHIEAGHYPVDAKGRALVPMKNGETATILATDRDEAGGLREPIAGWVDNSSLTSWWPHGEHSRRMPSDMDLLPPPPRKVVVKRWVEYDPACNFFSSTWESDLVSGGVNPRKGCVIIELTGEYEEPWT